MNTNTIHTPVNHSGKTPPPPLLNTVVAVTGNALGLLIGLYSMALMAIHSQKANAIKIAKYSSIFAIACIVAVIFMQLFLRAIDIEYEANLAIVEQHHAEIEKSFYDSQKLK